MEDLIPVKEIALQTKLPETTVRRYCSLFSQYLPSRQFGRVTKYQPVCIEVIMRISELYSQGLSTLEVEEILGGELPITLDVEEGNENQLPAVIPPKMAAVLQEMITKFETQEARIAEQDKIIQELHEELEDFRSHYTKDKETLMDDLEMRDRIQIERIRGMLEEKKKPWWKRLLG